MSDEQTLFYLRLPMEERRKLPFGPPYISDEVTYKLAEEKRLAAEADKDENPGTPKPK